LNNKIIASGIFSVPANIIWTQQTPIYDPVSGYEYMIPSLGYSPNGTYEGGAYAVFKSNFTATSFSGNLKAGGIKRISFER
jgi:hypothetical protein